MKAVLPVVAFLAATLGAGCVATDETPAGDAEETPAFNYEDDRINIMSINESAIDWVPNLNEPPQLTLGEWWKVTITDDFEGETVEGYIVAAGQEADYWLLGMPTHDFSNELMVLHIPGMGQVEKATLGFEAHDVWFHPLHFPLVVGDTWTTGLMNAPDNVNAEVISIEGNTAVVEFTGAYHALITYDAEIRNIRKFQVDNYATYEVLEHGFAFHEDVPNLEGTVTVPHMSDLILCHGMAATVVALNPDSCGLGLPGAPMTTAVVETTYDRVSADLILVADAFAGIAGAPASAPATVISLTVTAPDGSVYEDTLTAADLTPIRITSLKHDAPGGDWEVQAVAPGPALAFIEGIGYHVYDVELPSGRILPSIGEHQHGDGEGH